MRGALIALLLLAAALAAPNRAAPKRPAAPPGSPSFLLLSLDTFRLDRLAVGGNTKGITPNLDRFAERSVVFTQAYTQASTTSPSHAALFTGRYPTEVHGPTRAPVLEDRHTLPEVLGLYGYDTAARVAGGDLAGTIGPTKGFDSYQAPADFGSLFHTLPAGLKWLDARDATRPFFLFLHSYDAHPITYKPTPFGLLFARTGDLSESQARLLLSTERVFDGHLHDDLGIIDGLTRRGLRPWPQLHGELAEAATAAGLPVVTEAEQDLVRQVYDGAAAYADAWFGVMLSRLQDRGLLDTTWIIVLADHGEALGEEGLFHRCCSLADPITRVPLIVRPPGGIEGRTVEGMVELIDVMPTVLELAGAAAPAGTRGQSFAGALWGEAFEGRPHVFTEGGIDLRISAVRTPRGRLTWWGVDCDNPLRAELLEHAALPGPSFVVDGLSEAEAKQARADMVGWVRSLEVPHPSQVVETPADLAEELRKRGYWDAK